MDQGTIINLAQDALSKIILISAPMLGLSLIVGLAVSIFQATTQIQEQTLTFIPKLVAIVAGVALFGSWMLQLLIEYTENLYMNINNYIK